jgi:hypothetical protein
MDRLPLQLKGTGNGHLKEIDERQALELARSRYGANVGFWPQAM